MDYDVLILGGGIVGCAVAYELSKYSLNIALIEKEQDIADDVALINTSVLYDGTESQDTLISKLEFMGNNMMNEVAEKFNIRLKRCNFLSIMQNEKEINNITSAYSMAIERGLKNVSQIDRNSVYELEPCLSLDIKGALYSQNSGVISPYNLAIGYGEVAFDNGVNFRLDETVIDIKKINKGFRVTTNKNKFTCKLVVNTIPEKNYSIHIGDKDEEDYKPESLNLNCFIIDKEFKGASGNIVSVIDKEGYKISIVPSIQGDTIAYVSSEKEISAEQALEKVKAILIGVEYKYINEAYKSSLYKDRIIIDDSYVDKGYIKVKGRHYGIVTMTPAIAKIVCETIISNVNCKLKKDFYDRRRELYRFSEMSNEERKKLIEMDKKYGRIICTCSKVTEGEIVDAIRRPLGARTLEGIRRRTGAMLGECKSSYCINKVLSILARETNKKPMDVINRSKNSNILLGRIKEF